MEDERDLVHDAVDGKTLVATPLMDRDAHFVLFSLLVLGYYKGYLSDTLFVGEIGTYIDGNLVPTPAGGKVGR